MKRNYLISLFLLFLLYACKNEDKPSTGTSENNVDAARNFIRALLDGKFREARAYMLNDSINTNYLDVVERFYQRDVQDNKDGYRTSTIHIHSVDSLNDSTTVVVYSNSFKNNPDTLKVLKVKDQWLVDLKYLYEHDRDTLYKKKILKDTLR